MEGKIQDAVNRHINPALKKLKMRPIKGNPDTKKVYAASMDGTQVAELLDDLAILYTTCSGANASLRDTGFTEPSRITHVHAYQWKGTKALGTS